MTITSYAQNFEDIILWRFLGHIEKGFYIDIGAQDPIVDSVSYSFYLKGWRGVHVEPTQQYSKKLIENRPDEVVRQVAIGSALGSIEFYEFPDTGLSTANPSIAEKHSKEGFLFQKVVVPVTSLDLILDTSGAQQIHWMKVDVEGQEKQVVESWKTSLIRPWFLIIESTYPLSSLQTHSEWERLILEKKYKYIYFDGLNRFYVHEDKMQLVDGKILPPNWFDKFTLGSTHHLVVSHLNAQREKYLAQIESGDNEIRQLRDNYNQFEISHKAMLQISNEKAIFLEKQLAQIINSSSWKVTKPLRNIGVAIRKIIYIYRRIFVIESKPLFFVYKQLRMRIRRFSFKAVKLSKSRISKSHLYNVNELEAELKDLTPVQCKIYIDIKEEIRLSLSANENID